MTATCTCENCGTLFDVKESRAKKHKPRFCTNKCRSDFFNKNKSMVKCKGCEKLFHPKRSSELYCSKECFNESLKKRTKCTCEICGTEFDKIDALIKKGRGKYCSEKCYRKSRRKRVSKICENCGTEFEVRLSENEKGEGKFCTTKCRCEYYKNHHPPTYKQIILTCIWCGEEYSVSPSRVKRGQTFCSDGCRGAYFYYGKHKEHDTDIEILVDDALNKLNINHECQYRIGRYIADFYLPEYNLVIEADGEFWHNLPKMIEKDKRKDAYLAAHHYNLLRLPGNYIKFDAVKSVLYGIAEQAQAL